MLKDFLQEYCLFKAYLNNFMIPMIKKFMGFTKVYSVIASGSIFIELPRKD